MQQRQLHRSRSYGEALVWTWLSCGLTCTSGCLDMSEVAIATGEEIACREYKRALSRHIGCDPQFTTPDIDGSFDAYRCLSEAELRARGLEKDLSDCTRYLDALHSVYDGPVDGIYDIYAPYEGKEICDVPLRNRERCKHGYLEPMTPDTRLSSADVGEYCEIDHDGPLSSEPAHVDLSPGDYLWKFPSRFDEWDCEICLVAGLDGNPGIHCDPSLTRCPSEEELADSVYCSCRCDAADTGHPTCECPAGFECREAFPNGGPGLVGSYCVRL